MFTEYIFENKKYELAVRDLKSTLFDIVAIENAKLSDIELRVSREVNPDKQEELKELWERQNACLKHTLEVSSELSDSLMQLDSYSKELNKLEDENIAEMIANLGDRKVERAYQKDIKLANRERDNLAEKMVRTAGDLNNDVYSNEEIVENIRTVQEGMSREEPQNAGYDIVVENTESEEEDVSETENELENVQEVSDEDVQAEIVNEEASLETTDEADVIVMPEIDNSEDDLDNETVNDVPEDEAEEESIKEVEGSLESSDDEAEIDTDAALRDDEVSDEIVDENSEDSVDEQENVANNDGVSENSVDMNDTQSDENFESEVEPEANDEATILIPEVSSGLEPDVEESAVTADGAEAGSDDLENEAVIQDLVSDFSENTEMEEQSTMVAENGEGEPELKAETTSNIDDDQSVTADSNSINLEPILPVDIPVVSDIVDKQEAVATENSELARETDMNIVQKIRFLKANASVTRAIITAKKQITNLRNSRETAKALLKVKNSVSDVPIATNTMQAVEKSLEDEKNMEQQLINNGLLEPTVVDKQRQIEEMLEKANALYKEGNVEEAQVMYDQISALNREIQAAANVVAR